MVAGAVVVNHATKGISFGELYLKAEAYQRHVGANIHQAVLM